MVARHGLKFPPGAQARRSQKAPLEHTCAFELVKAAVQVEEVPYRRKMHLDTERAGGAWLICG